MELKQISLKSRELINKLLTIPAKNHEEV